MQSFFAKTPTNRASSPSSSSATSESEQGTPAPAGLPYHARFPPPQPGDMCACLRLYPAFMRPLHAILKVAHRHVRNSAMLHGGKSAAMCSS